MADLLQFFPLKSLLKLQNAVKNELLEEKPENLSKEILVRVLSDTKGFQQTLNRLFNVKIENGTKEKAV